jgi:hypothetical protein
MNKDVGIGLGIMFSLFGAAAVLGVIGWVMNGCPGLN